MTPLPVLQAIAPPNIYSQQTIYYPVTSEHFFLFISIIAENMLYQMEEIAEEVFRVSDVKWELLVPLDFGDDDEG